MMKVFDITGRTVGTLLGLVLGFAGFAWILQAFDLAFNTPMGPGGQVSFMVNNRQWAVYGAIAMVLGLAHAVWCNTGSRR